MGKKRKSKALKKGAKQYVGKKNLEERFSQKKKIITSVVFAFILLAAWLAAGGTNLIVELSNSLNALFATAHAPHFVQMHASGIDQGEIDRWAAANSLVKAQQTVKMITIDGSALYLGTRQNSEEHSIMDISFVRQNKAFDFLLDMENRIPSACARGNCRADLLYAAGTHADWRQRQNQQSVVCDELDGCGLCAGCADESIHRAFEAFCGA